MPIITPRRYIQSALARGLAGDQAGTVSGYVAPSMLGAPFNGGTILATGAATTPEILVAGYNQFMVIARTDAPSPAMTLFWQTLDPEDGAVLFSDTLGSVTNGAFRRFTFAGFFGPRPDDSWIRVSILANAGAGADTTNIFVRVWGSRR